MIVTKSSFADETAQLVLEGMRHPFRQRVADGLATRADLAVFAVQTYQRNLWSSRFASANHSRCPIPEIRRSLLEVAYEEELKGPGQQLSHAEQMLIFTDALGLRREDVVNSRPLPGTLAFIDTIMKLSEGHWLEAIAFRASEQNSPKGSAIWAEVLQRVYGFSPEAVVWWSTHAVADVAHGNISMEVYRHYVRDASERELALRALERMFAAWRVFFDNIVEAGQSALTGGEVGFVLPSSLRR